MFWILLVLGVCLVVAGLLAVTARRQYLQIRRLLAELRALAAAAPVRTGPSAAANLPVPWVPAEDR